MFLSQTEEKSEIHIGDYNTDFIEGGFKAIDWYELTSKTDWQTDLTALSLGDDIIISHSYQPAIINSGSHMIGLQDDSFRKVADVLKRIGDNVYCDEEFCFGKEECDFYTGKVADLNFMLNNKGDYTINGNKLFAKEGENYAC